MAKKAAVPFQCRQGDVFLERVDAMPGTAKARQRDNGRVILAYGEVTGHAHVIDTPTKEDAIYDGENGDFYLRIEDAAGLVHDEHARIDLPAGIYRGRIQREYTPTAIRNVAD